MDYQEQPDVLGLKIKRRDLVKDVLDFTTEDWGTISRLVREETWKYGSKFKKTGYGAYLVQSLLPKVDAHYDALLEQQRAKFGGKLYAVGDDEQ